MKYIVSAEEMKRYDKNTIEKIGIPGVVLMERAALAVADRIENSCGNIGATKTVFVMAGMGNNGGDGLAVARILSERGYNVEVMCVGEQKKSSDQWKEQYHILQSYPVKYVAKPTQEGYTVLVDALFGVGLSKDVEGVYAEAITCFQTLEGRKFAVDIPSGISSDTGAVLGTAVTADETITFGFLKRGLVMYPGCEYAGKVTLADIGISHLAFMGESPNMFAYDDEPSELMPKRVPFGNKGTFGKVLLIAGSVNMSGAAVLAAKAAYRTGAGMVKVITPADNRSILQQAVPEALCGQYEDLDEAMKWADILAIGPGLGMDRDAYHCMEKVICQSKKPLLIDADGLNLLAKYPALRENLAESAAGGRECVLTPHVGELARLLTREIKECKTKLWEAGCEIANKLHCVVVAKDARSFICKENHPVCVNLTGNSGMATAGSGDVLAGMIAALMAQGADAFHGASTGAYLHGMAGDYASMELGEYACMAGDIISQIGKCVGSH